MNINEAISGQEYSFLSNCVYLHNILFLCFGGSHAYGLNTETSDVDIRGCCFPPMEGIVGCGFLQEKTEPYVILGENGFEQITETNTDTTIYSFYKLLKLLYNCNPNTIEMLGCREQDYIIYHPAGQYLIDNGEVFLSKMAYRSFAEYARGQFQRLKNALGRQRQGNLSNCLCMADAIGRMQKHLEREYSDYNSNMVNVRITDKSGSPVYCGGKQIVPDDVELLFYDNYKELTVNGKPIKDDDIQVTFDVHIDGLPSNQVTSVMNEIGSNIKEFNKVLGHRNHKKDDYHLSKHAMHLLRLYMMGREILENHVINTYRVNEHDFLMSVKNGAYFNGESFSKEFFDIVSELSVKLDEAYKNTTLPDTPNKNHIIQLSKKISSWFF